MPRLSSLTTAATLALLAGSACRCEPDLLELQTEAAAGKVSLVDAANPEGGARPTAGSSDLSVPPREGDLGWWVDLAVAPDGTLHVAYTDAFNGELRHAQQDGKGGWSITVVDRHGAVGKYPALAVDTAGRPHVIYYNQDKKRLVYATRVGAQKIDPDDRRRPFQGDPAWFFEVVDDGDEVGMAAELRVMRDGSLHAVYYATKETFIHVRREASPPGEHRHWDRKIIDDHAGGSHSIVVSLIEGPDGTLHTTYANWTVFDSFLRYATLTPGAKAWVHQTLPTAANTGWKSGLALTSKEGDGDPIITTLSLRNRRILLLARAPEAEDGWTITPLVGNANTLALIGTPEGGFYLPYEHLPGVGLADARVQVLHHAAGATTDTGYTLRSLGRRGAMASYLATALLPDGRLAVAWYDGGVRGVKVWVDTAHTK